MEWGRIDEFVEKMYRRSKSVNSRRYYRFGAEDFKEFCEVKHVKSIDQKNVYAVLDEYVSHLDKKGLKPKTIADYVTAIRKFLTYLDIETDSAKFKSKVTMPRVTKIEDEPLTLEAVRTLLTRGRPNPRMRALILTLLSSGMRIGEALSVQWKDVDLQSTPITLKLRAEYTKTRTARTAYASEEAKEALTELAKSSPAEGLVFDYSGNVWQRQKEAGYTFRKLVERVGLDEKIEGHRIHKIHFHSFRKFFFTKAVDTLGDHVGHALCGHGFYMDTYYRKSEDERKQDYLKLMPRLTVFGGGETHNLKEAFREQLLLVAGFTKEEVGRMDLKEIPDEELQRTIRQRLLGMMPDNGPRQRVIPVSEVESHLFKGWEFVAALPGDRAVLKLPQ
ncbi:MAG: tyrosine-type recombinase/integrase [Nitrososphaerales archaeon]